MKFDSVTMEKIGLFANPVAPSDEAIRKASLLVVEDVALHRSLLARIGTKIGFDTSTAHSCSAALILLSRRKFDCISLDLALGDDNGDRVLTHLAELRSTARILLVSGAEEQERNRLALFGNALGLDVRCAIRKPVDLKRLSEIMIGVYREVSPRS